MNIGSDFEAINEIPPERKACFLPMQIIGDLSDWEKGDRERSGNPQNALFVRPLDPSLSARNGIGPCSLSLPFHVALPRVHSRRQSVSSGIACLPYL